MALTCFVICPFGDEGSETRQRSNHLFEKIIRPTAEEAGYQCFRLLDRAAPGEITASMVTQLATADLVIADLTGSNANVFYELALRHATGKPFIHLSEQPGAIPFDISTMNSITIHRDEMILETVHELEQQIDQIREQKVDFSSTVSHFFSDRERAGKGRFFRWRFMYSQSLHADWLNMQPTMLQNCISSFESGQSTVPEDSAVRNKMAEYLLYKVMKGQPLAGDLYYFASEKTGLIASYGWANFELAHSDPMAIKVEGYDRGNEIELSFRQPSRVVTIGPFNEAIRDFYYTVKFKRVEPGEEIFRGVLTHPDFPDVLVASTELVPV